MKKNYSNEIYKMYEEEVNKNKEKDKRIKELELEVFVLKSNLKISENKINTELQKVAKPFIEENSSLKVELAKAYEEINRLKNQINNSEKDYLIDKLDLFDNSLNIY